MRDADDSSTWVASESSVPPPKPSGETCLVIIYGPGLGTKVSLDEAETTIGRGSASDFVVKVKDVSRRHCRITRTDGGLMLRDLGSTNGTSVNDEPLSPNQDVRLASGDHVNLGGMIFKVLEGGDVETRYHEEIYRTAIVDGLTQIYNRRYLTEFLEREMARAARYERPLALLLLDVDHFKSINDEFGHVAGDAVLRDVAQRLGASMRKECCFARYGGEEFAVVLPETTPEDARIAAERVRTLVAEAPFMVEDREISLTVSVGVAVMQDGMSDPVQLFHQADEQLYTAKHSGRNAVAG